MDEYHIATKLVLPHIKKELSWPDQLISRYGRVPVQVGTTTLWADLVFYIVRNNLPVPWLLVEVKTPGTPLEEALPQAESYSLILDVPFLCISNGSHYRYYVTGEWQGTSIELRGPPPPPSPKFLPKIMPLPPFPPGIDHLVELFLLGLRTEDKFLQDTQRHDTDAKCLHATVFRRIDSLCPDELKEALHNHVMLRRPNLRHIFQRIDEDFARVLRYLEFIRDFPGDEPVVDIYRLLDKTGDLYLKGAGIFFITQLLAGAHPNQYVVLEENITRALQQLGITGIVVKNDTANGYVFVNEICRRLYEEKLRPKLGEHDFGLAAVHNFLWHYYVYYRSQHKWFP